MDVRSFRLLFSGVLIAAMAVGCGSKEPAPETPDTSAPAAASASKYDSPEAAFDALIEASRSGSHDSIRDILGMESDAVLGAGDPVQFQNDVEEVVAKYDERHVTAPNEGGGVTLVVGSDDWPFPIPVVQQGGSWTFDLAAGLEEIDNRRIGRNELAAIQVCRAIVDAQREYQAMNPEGTGAYAAKFVSDEGKKNGLYWPATEGEPQSPLGELAATASAEGYKRGTTEEPAAYWGYHYRILTEQGPHAPGKPRDYYVDGQLTGGFAVLAWPAEYGRSGIMSFLTNPLGVVYERDLGAETSQIASEMKSFDPTPEWNVCLD